MYKPTDAEILDAYDDYLEDLSSNNDYITRSDVWLEAWKRGMRFNSNAVLTNKSTGHKKQCR